MQDNFPVALAPLAGVTDQAFRRICRKYGADVVTTEMISSKGLYYRDKKTAELLAFSEIEQPIGIQLFGSDPAIMAYAAQKVEEYGPAFIDLNMGCPVPKIAGNGDGCALMKDPALAGRVIEEVVKHVSVPVAVKFRAGFDDEHRNAVEFARVVEQSGASFLTVHGRTREQFYSGKADWSVIRDVKQAVKIFVFGNGDVFSAEDAVRMRQETACDGVMVARGSLGNPFLFQQIKDYMTTGSYRTYSATERLQAARVLVQDMCEFKRQDIAIREARRHMAWFFKGLPHSSEYKNKAFSATTLAQMNDVIDRYLEQFGREKLDG